MKVSVLYNSPNPLLIKMVRINDGEKKKSLYSYLLTDFTVSPSVWLGTSTGCVIVINLNINYEPRNISGKDLVI